MRDRVLLPDPTEDSTPAHRRPLTIPPSLGAAGPGGWAQGEAEECRLPRLSGEKPEGQKAAAGVFFRKEIFAVVTVWESPLSPAVRPSQEAPPPAPLAGPVEANTFEDRKGRGEVSIKAAVEFGGGPSKGVPAILSADGGSQGPRL